METIERLKKMVNQPFLYNNEQVVVLNYCAGTGEDGDEVEIYLNNGKTLCYKVHDLKMILNRFKPITSTVVVLANERLNQVSTVNPTIIKDLRDVVLDQIKAVKENPAAINQAKQVFQGVNTLINLAKTELDYRRYLDKTQKLNQES
jgi:phenolic acid decarboxylase